MSLAGDDMVGKLELLRKITNNFSEEQKVGSGGYGDVYRAIYNGQEIAVKKFYQHKERLGDKEFKNEVLNLREIQHQNIVRLLGYCYEIQHMCVDHNGRTVLAEHIERLLCFEYMQGGSLEKHISDESCDLDWPASFQIIRGICEGLNHLHTAKGKPIFHLDLKPANILLDKNNTAKIGDLGLSKLAASSKTQSTKDCKGTMGYMPPEYINGGFFSKKSDVFSLGVIIIKMLAGNTGYDRHHEMPPERFVEFVTEKWKEKLQRTKVYLSQETDILQLKTCVDIALRCVKDERDERPYIKDIVNELEKLGPQINKISTNPAYYRSGGSHDIRQTEHRFHLYMTQRAVGTTDSNETFVAGSGFGSIYVDDFTIRDGPVPTANLVGRARGMHVCNGIRDDHWLFCHSILFTDTRFKGSSIKMLGDFGYENDAEWAIVGGSGEFAYAHGAVRVKVIQTYTPATGRIFELRIRAFCFCIPGKTKMGPWDREAGAAFDIPEAEPPRRLETVTVGYGDVINSVAFSYTNEAGQKKTAGPWGSHGADNETGEMKSTTSIIEAPMSSSLGAMGPLLRKLDSLLASENQLRKSVKHTIKLLMEDLEEIIADLMELSTVDCPNYKARYWMHEVRELSYHIEDCIDSMIQEHTAARAKVRSVRRPRFRVGRVNIPWLPKTVEPSARIAELRTLLRDASERHKRYQLQDCASEPKLLSSGNSRLPASSVAAAELFGVDEARSKLASWIIDQAEQQLKVLSIHGPAGVGKTALIKELYRELGQKFECRAFIRVSRNADMKRLLGEVLSQVQGSKRDYDACTADILIDRISTHLQDKRYFIVIDELWEAAAWDIINTAFPKGDNCSRIIITAEVKNVAVKCCGYHCASTFEITPLESLEASGQIFFDRVFGSEHKCPHQLKDISCKIIRRCDGLPLAIITIAGLFASQIDNTTELWHYLQQCFFSRLTSLTLEEMVKEVVKISYDALPQDLKTCLLYLAMYPEGCTIWKIDLLNQWIAEGFIRPTQGKQGVAESYFDELIERGMIQPDKINYNDEVLSCTVHHTVFDLIAQKSREENFITAVDYSQVMPGFSMITRRLSLYFSCAQFAAKPEGIKLSPVRSLAFFGLFRCMPSITEFKFIRLLILEFWGDNYDRTSLDLSKMCMLFQLRYLKISSHFAIILPSQIQRLQWLETLEIDAEVLGVPADILHLPGLMHLSLPNGTKLPDGIGRITSLQTLEYFDLGNNSEDNVRSLSELTNLKNLQITCSIALSDHQLKRNLAALSSSLGRLGNLKSLRVGPCAVGMTMFIDEGAISGTPVLLQRLELLPPTWIFSRLPRWIGGLQNLRILKIVVRILLSSDIDTLTGLHELTVLSFHVQNCNLETVVFNSGALPVLKYFNYNCGAVRLAFQEEALPNLQKLKLCFNVHRDESDTSKLAGIEHLLKLKAITAKIGAAAGADETDKRAAVSVLKEATRKHPRFPIPVNVKWVDCIKENSKPAGFMHRSPYVLEFFVLFSIVLMLLSFYLSTIIYEV